MIADWIKQYKPQNKEETQQALREIMQEIALAALARAGFFQKAAFYGGTALRIFYALPRYSEDLDFSLLKVDKSFRLANYLNAIVNEFEALGLKISVNEKTKKTATAIDSAFLKSETFWRELVLEDTTTFNVGKEKIYIKIKLEIDTQPPSGFTTEEKLLLKPFSCYVKCFSASDLFAGKVHALLFRKWKNRVKGRDWFDFEWYIKQGIQLNVSHLSKRAKDSGDWTNKKQMSSDDVLKLLHEKIESVSMKQVKEDVENFVADSSALDIWSAKYFNDLLQKIKFLEK